MAIDKTLLEKLKQTTNTKEAFEIIHAELNSKIIDEEVIFKTVDTWLNIKN